MDGRVIKNTFEIQDNKLIEHQIDEKRKITIIREFQEDKMFGESIFKGGSSKHLSVAEN